MPNSRRFIWLEKELVEVTFVESNSDPEVAVVVRRRVLGGRSLEKVDFGENREIVLGTEDDDVIDLGTESQGVRLGVDIHHVVINLVHNHVVHIVLIRNRNNFNGIVLKVEGILRSHEKDQTDHAL